VLSVANGLGIPATHKEGRVEGPSGYWLPVHQTMTFTTISSASFAFGAKIDAITPAWLTLSSGIARRALFGYEEAAEASCVGLGSTSTAGAFVGRLAGLSLGELTASRAGTLLVCVAEHAVVHLAVAVVVLPVAQLGWQIGDAVALLIARDISLAAVTAAELAVGHAIAATVAEAVVTANIDTAPILALTNRRAICSLAKVAVVDLTVAVIIETVAGLGFGLAIDALGPVGVAGHAALDVG
jgi:hypothetical protein